MKFIILAAIAACVFLTSEAASARDRRQTCSCSPAEPPKCSCQVLNPNDPTQKVQMVCSCTAPVAPKCVCQETIAKPALPSPVELATVTSRIKCTDVCQKSCLEPCSRLQSNNKCIEVCADACKFSCSKSDATNRGNTISEYKFIIPSEMKAVAAPVRLPPPPPHVAPRPTLVYLNTSPTPPSPVCALECMPDCAFACTAFKPALKVLGQVLEGKAANSGECQKTCSDTCLRVCIGSGVTTKECSINCNPACIETCGLVAKKTGHTLSIVSGPHPSPPATVIPNPPQFMISGGTVPAPLCFPSCMPACTTQCVQKEILLLLPAEAQGHFVMTAPPLPPPVPVSHWIQRNQAQCCYPNYQPDPAPMPPPPSAAVMVPIQTESPAVIHAISQRCQNECSVQCDHQCGVNSLAGPQCLAACQTTCYPVCQAKLRRRKHKKQPTASSNRNSQ